MGLMMTCASLDTSTHGLRILDVKDYTAMPFANRRLQNRSHAPILQLLRSRSSWRTGCEHEGVL
jgi:hypothetical protein